MQDGVKSQFPLMTILVVTIVVIAAGVGGAVVIWGPAGTLSFNDYLNDLKAFAFACAALGSARALRIGIQNHGLGDGTVARNTAAVGETTTTDMPAPVDEAEVYGDAAADTIRR